MTPPRRIAVGASVLLALAAGAVRTSAHELPSFPRAVVLAVRPDPLRPLSRSYTVEVLDPSGRRPVQDADVRVTGFERSLGSGVRLGSFWLAPTPTAGIYQGTVDFPRPGRWELTITVKGASVGEAHVEATVGAADEDRGLPLDRPQLGVDRILIRHLLLEWGHLAGFGLWIGSTALALASTRTNPRAVVALTWLALAVEGGTGLYKMEVGTPFPRGLSFGWWNVPRIFFGREYVFTLRSSTSSCLPPWL